MQRTIPYIIDSLYVYFMEHPFVWSCHVILHLHGNMLRQHTEEKLLLQPKEKTLKQKISPHIRHLITIDNLIEVSPYSNMLD